MMRYRVKTGQGRDRTITLGLSDADIGALLGGGVVRIVLSLFGVPDPFGKRLYVLSMDTPELAKWRESRMMPTEWGRVDCVERQHLEQVRDSGHQVSLPRDRNGIEVRITHERQLVTEAKR